VTADASRPADTGVVDSYRPADTGIVDSYRPESAPGYGPRSSASPGRPAAARPAWLLVRRAGRQQGSRI